MQHLDAVSATKYAVIDKDTGTVLGTNLVLVPAPDDPEVAEEITSSDAAAIDYANQHGIPLLAAVAN